MTGIVGKKLGMTQIFDESGRAVPVTVIEARPGVVVEIKTNDKHGYEALKVGFFEDKKEKHYTRAELGMFRKADVEPQRLLREFSSMGDRAVGDKITLEGFAAGDTVNVIGTSKGKGFQGGMKRHNFKGGPGGHGSMFNRAVGSIGSSATPSRVFKGKKMPGHMGTDRVTVKNLKVADVRIEQNLILIEGAVPGARNSVVEIRKED
jgi:large subunit ribosomal protein L3